MTRQSDELREARERLRRAALAASRPAGAAVRLAGTFAAGALLGTGRLRGRDLGKAVAAAFVALGRRRTRREPP